MTEETRKEDTETAMSEKKVDEQKEEQEGTATAVTPGASNNSTDNVLTEEDLKAVELVKERLSFFFSDANVRQDIFMRKLLTDKNSDEMSVPVDVMLKFHTIKKHTEKPAVVIQAAKELTDLLVVNEEKATISRVVPFTYEMMNGHVPLSLYVKNLPIQDGGDDDASPKHYDVKVDELRHLFEKYGDVALVKLKFSSNDAGTPNKKQKRKKNSPVGAAMIEFHKKEDLEKAAEATLTIKDGKKIEPKEKVILPATESRKSHIELEVMLFSEFRETKKRDRDEAADDKVDVSNGNEKEDLKTPKFTIDWQPGCVIQLKGLSKGCDREGILDAVAKGLEISVEEVRARKIYADFSRGQTDGAIRFPEHGDFIVDLAKRLKEGEIKIDDAKVEEVTILDGDEEKKYWDNFIEYKNKQILQKGEEKRARKKQKRGGRRSH